MVFNPFLYTILVVMVFNPFLYTIPVVLEPKWVFPRQRMEPEQNITTRIVYKKGLVCGYYFGLSNDE
jgi:hypothetical protein